MNEIFSILSSGRARTNVILAGKCGSRPQSAASFSENRESFWRENVVAVVILLRVFARNVVMAKTRYQMLEVLSFCDRESA